MCGVLALAAILRLWGLSRPEQLVFDEIYYVRDALSQLTHGFPTTWPNDSAGILGPSAQEFSAHANAIAHPPLGKWLIGIGFLALGTDTAWAWRIAVAVTGIATVALTMRLGWLMTRNVWIAALAGLLLAIDGVHVVLSRVSLFDGFLTFFVVLGALFVWHDQAHGSRAGRIRWWRPWLIAAGLAFGAAAAVKWSGLYPLAAFLLLIALRDVILRRRAAVSTGQSRGTAFLRSVGQAAVTLAITLPAALVAYLASWIGWILHPTAQNRQPGEPWWVSLWQWHIDAFTWHSSLSTEHPYQSAPIGWPFGLRPTLMFWEYTETGPACPWAGGCVTEISPIPNLLVTWGGVIALLVLCWIIARATWGVIAARRRVSPGPGAPLSPRLWGFAFVLVGFGSGWLPWVLTVSRSAVFQFYSVVLTPFSALALALVLALLLGAGREAHALVGFRLSPAPEAARGRRIAVGIYLAAAALLAALYFPLWSGLPVAEWFWRAHMWLPGWR